MGVCRITHSWHRNQSARNSPESGTDYTEKFRSNGCNPMRHSRHTSAQDAIVVFQKRWDTTCACQPRQPTCGATGTTRVGTDERQNLFRKYLQASQVACRARRPHQSAPSAPCLPTVQMDRWRHALMCESRQLHGAPSVALQA